MPELLTEKSVLRCTKGSSPMPLGVTSQQLSKINGLLKATEADKIPMVNIPRFGTCMQGSYPPPCLPACTAWQNVSNLDKINGLKCLTVDSTIQCSMGGIISVEKVSQSLSTEG